MKRQPNRDRPNWLHPSPDERPYSLASVLLATFSIFAVIGFALGLAVLWRMAG